MKLRRAVLALVALPTPALASDWIKMGESANGSAVMVDADTMKKDGDIITIWAKYDLSKISTEIARSQSQLMEINCRTEMLRITFSIKYSPSGNVLKSQESPYASFRPVVPDSVGASIQKNLCEIYAEVEDDRTVLENAM